MVSYHTSTLHEIQTTFSAYHS